MPTEQDRSMYWIAHGTGIAYTTLHRLGKARAFSGDFGVLGRNSAKKGDAK
ncbi:MAG: hypothetical protein J2P41_15185 [Blastocatellia bacterium]|nr:hypothetical protein [Blastocatellia bacterium]